jgi:hypothetical protein
VSDVDVEVVDASTVHDQWRTVALAAHDVQVASGHAVRMSVLDENTPAGTTAWLADLAAKVERLRVEHALLCEQRTAQQQAQAANGGG